MIQFNQIADNLNQIRTQISTAQSNLQAPFPVEILAVTKYSDIETLRLIHQTGLSHFGENRVQLAIPKIQALPHTIHWSMIGHLQSNKVREAVQYFDRIQSVDSIRLLESIQKAAYTLNKTIDVFLQVNMTHETQKYGFTPTELIHHLPHLGTYPNIKITGMMAFGPHTENKVEIQACFEQTHTLFKQLALVIPSCKILSMGMSQDFTIAVAAGATQVRIGQRLIA